MTAFMDAAVAVTAVISLTALGLGLVLARRYRELHQAVTQSRTSQLAPPAEMLPAPGTRAEPFSATATDGTPVESADFVEGDSVIAFLMGGCGPCSDSVPALRGLVEAGGRRALVVATGSPEERADYVRQLAPVVSVVEEEMPGRITDAYGIRAFPAFLLVRDGAVHQATTSLSELDLHPVTA